MRVIQNILCHGFAGRGLLAPPGRYATDVDFDC